MPVRTPRLPVFALAGLLCLGACSIFSGVRTTIREPEGYQPGFDRSGQAIGQTNVTTNRYNPFRQQVTHSTSGMDFDASVARSGEWLVFASSRNSEHSDIYYQKLKGQAVRRLIDHPAMDINPTVSPDEKWLAFSSNREGSYDIYVMPLDAAEPSHEIRRVTRDDTDEIRPSWSPDGRKLVYCAYSPVSDEWRMWTINPFKSDAPTDIGEGLFPAWSPVTDPKDQNFDTIAFQKHRRRDVPWYSIWTVKADGTHTVELLQEEFGMMTPSWHPTGQWIVFATSAKRPDRMALPFTADDIWMIRPDGTGLSVVNDDKSSDWSPTWAADGWLYYTSDLAGRPHIWRVFPTLQELNP